MRLHLTVFAPLRARFAAFAFHDQPNGLIA
jgi:hypothetical protein